MTLNIGSYSELSSADVAQGVALLTQLTREQHPQLHLRYGALLSLLTRPAAEHYAANLLLVDRLRRSGSLLAIEQDPTLADAELVDAVLSNFGVTRRLGSQASGQVTLVVSRLTTITVAAGAVFDIRGQQFRAQAAYVARTSSANVQSDYDRVLSPAGTGLYSFTIPLLADEVGEVGRVRRGDAVIPATPIQHFHSAYVAADFTGGDNTETNAELVARLREGLSARVLSNRTNISAMLREQVPTLRHLSVIGYGDAEMRRDRRSILGISAGGRVDCYVVTSELPVRKTVTLTAALVDKSEDRGIWQTNLDRDVAPGFYDVVQITAVDSQNVTGSYPLVSDSRAVDSTPELNQLLPDIDGLVEGAYSRFQTAVIRFRDTATPVRDLSLGATADYAVTVRYMPHVDELQQFVGDRDVRNTGGDLLVRAAVPCFVSIAIGIEAAAGELAPDSDVIKQAVAAHVNGLGFCGRLSAAAIHQVVGRYLTRRMAIIATDMFAKLRKPDGSWETLRDSKMLRIPTKTQLCTSMRTTCFYLDPVDVALSIRGVSWPD